MHVPYLVALAAQSVQLHPDYLQGKVVEVACQPYSLLKDGVQLRVPVSKPVLAVCCCMVAPCHWL